MMVFEQPEGHDYHTRKEEVFWNDKISKTETAKEDLCGMVQNFALEQFRWNIEKRRKNNRK